MCRGGGRGGNRNRVINARQTRARLLDAADTGGWVDNNDQSANQSVERGQSSRGRGQLGGGRGSETGNTTERLVIEASPDPVQFHPTPNTDSDTARSHDPPWLDARVQSSGSILLFAKLGDWETIAIENGRMARRMGEWRMGEIMGEIIKGRRENGRMENWMSHSLQKQPTNHRSSQTNKS